MMDCCADDRSVYFTYCCRHLMFYLVNVSFYFFVESMKINRGMSSKVTL